MLTTQDFLARVVPPGAHYVIGLKRADGIGHRYLTDLDAAADFAQRADSDGHTVYFGCASFGPAAGGRKAENVAEVGALWLDIDCGPDKPYPSKRDALPAVARYAQAAGLPMPLVVDSGRGLHVYWPLSRPVSRAEWLPIANALKVSVEQHGLHTDRKRTADAASVLRPVGTTNHKDGGSRPVRAVLLNTTTLDPDRAAELLGAEANPPIAYGPVDNSALSAGLSSESAPPQADTVADGCLQLARMRDTLGKIDYPSWYGCLGILAYCEDGDEKAHEWSAGDERYKPSQVDRYLGDWRKLNGGSTCAKLGSDNPEGCVGCPYLGKIRSPLAIGRRVPVTVEDTNGTITTKLVASAPAPDMPFGFHRSQAGGITRRVEGEDGSLKDVVVSRTFFRPLRVINNSPNPTISAGYDIEFEAEYPTPGGHTTIRSFILPSKMVGGPTGEFATALSTHMVYAENEQSKKALQEYVQKYIQEMRNKQDETVTCNHFGWHDDGFLLGHDMLTHTGIKPATLTGNAVRRVKAFGGNGDVVKWADAVDRVCNQPGYEMFQFALLSSLAAPLYGFNPDTPAVFTYYYSSASGVGKTTAHMIGLSAWGDPEKMVLSGNAVTVNSLFALLGVYSNLPVVYDELTSQKVMAPGELIYWISHGTPKERLRTDGELRDNNASWETIVLGSGNNSLSNKIIGSRGDTTGERARLFEIPASPTPPLDNAREVFAEIFDNAGAAGPIYVAELVKQRLTLQATVLQVRRQIEARFGMTQQERFWASLFASVLVAHQVALKAGLVRFPVKDLVVWMRSVLNFNRDSMTRAQGNLQDDFAQLMADFLPYTLVTESPGGSRNAYVLALPHGRLAARTIVASGPNERTLFYLPAGEVLTWCKKKDVSLEELKAQLQRDKMWIKSEKMNLAAHVPQVPAMSTRCWVLDISHSEAGTQVDDFIQKLRVVSDAIA